MARLKTHLLRIITDEFVYLEDGGRGETITNDVDNIVQKLQLQWRLKNRRIYYKDSFGDIDEIVLKDGKFSHFQTASDTITKLIKKMMGWNYAS